VPPRRRVAVLGDDSAVQRLVRLLEKAPELELVVLRRSPTEVAEGYVETPDGRSYLFDDAPAGRRRFAATLVGRSIRLAVAARAVRRGRTPRLRRRGTEFLVALQTCELLVVGGPDAPPQRRERWRVAVTRRIAALLGLTVVLGSDPAELLPLLSRE
jgi:hypothetical protein